MKRNVNIKSMKYEDFNDNEYIEQMLKELRENGTNVIVGCLDDVIEPRQDRRISSWWQVPSPTRWLPC